MVAAGIALLVAAAFAATPRSGHFAGSTSGQGKTIKNVQDRSIRFNVSEDSVGGLKVGFKATCPSGTVDSDAVALHGSFLVRRGRFPGRGASRAGGPARSAAVSPPRGVRVGRFACVPPTRPTAWRGAIPSGAIAGS